MFESQIIVILFDIYIGAILVISAVVSAFQLELQGVKIAPCLWFQPLQSGRSPAVRDE